MSLRVRPDTNSCNKRIRVSLSNAHTHIHTHNPPASHACVPMNRQRGPAWAGGGRTLHHASPGGDSDQSFLHPPLPHLYLMAQGYLASCNSHVHLFHFPRFFLTTASLSLEHNAARGHPPAMVDLPTATRSVASSAARSGASGFKLSCCCSAMMAACEVTSKQALTIDKRAG